MSRSDFYYLFIFTVLSAFTLGLIIGVTLTDLKWVLL